MSVECSCLAFSYCFGQADLTERLKVAVGNVHKCPLVEKEAVLRFLLLLAGHVTSEEDRAVFNDSGVFFSELSHSLFETLPRTDDMESLQSALCSSQQVSWTARLLCAMRRTCWVCHLLHLQLLERAPGTGFHGWSSQQPLDDNRTGVSTSLFGGLTHSKVADVNTKLDFPSLPSQPMIKPAQSNTNCTPNSKPAQHNIGSKPVSNLSTCMYRMYSDTSFISGFILQWLC